jgi:signal transduction histidine kinase
MVDITSCRLFQELSAEEIAAVTERCQARQFKSGATVFKEGDPGDGMYVVISGQVRISAVFKQNQPQLLSRFGPGDFFGEMAVLDNEMRSATATAEQESELVFITREDWLDLLGRSPRLARSLVVQFSRRLRDFNKQFVDQMIQAERLGLVGRFARSIVHDFKNPLSIISLAAELGAGENSTDEMRRMTKDRIRKQVERLTNMINELLEFSRGSQGTVVLAMSDYDLFVRQLVDDLQTETSQHKVSLELANPPPKLRLLLDPRRLPHVFYNLVHNAVDFMSQGGRIVLSFTVSEKEVTTAIKDSGPGINPKVAERLFEPFVTYGKPQGTGLGLSICQRIILDHGGRIWACNAPEGGAVFSFTLPLPG